MIHAFHKVTSMSGTSKTRSMSSHGIVIQPSSRSLPVVTRWRARTPGRTMIHAFHKVTSMSGTSKTRSMSSHSIVIRPSPIHGKGVFARTKLSAGQKIAYFKGDEIDHDTRYTLVLDGKRIEPTGKLRYLNHSCAPNAHFFGRWLVTSRDIFHGEEIAIDYLATENMIYHHFTCKCGAKNCRGQV